MAGSGVSLFSPLPVGELSGSTAGVFLLAWGSALLAGVLSFASPKESSQRKGDPRVGAGYAGPLRYSAGRAAAELGATPLKQSSPKAPGPSPLLGAPHEARKTVGLKLLEKKSSATLHQAKRPKTIPLSKPWTPFRAP